MIRFSSCRLGLLLTAASLLVLPGSASAGERRYSAQGTAQFDNANDFVGSGKATHLGRYTEEGSVAFAPTADPTVLSITGWATYTADNGDELDAVVTGELNALTGEITATITYVGGTGRFEDASGESSLTGQLLPGGAITVTVEGKIDY